MITQKYLKEILDYDPETGIFRWKVMLGRKAKVGSVAGCRTSSGYIQITINGEIWLAHRLAWFYVFGNLPTIGLDHINRNGTDNRIENLREATASQNAFNCKPRKNFSGHTGVYWEKTREKWRARIQINGRKVNLGSFLTCALAIDARRAKEREIDGGFAKCVSQ